MDANPASRRSPLVFVFLLFALSIPFYYLARRPLFPAPAPFFPIGALMALLPMCIALGLTAREQGWRAAARLLGGAFAAGKVRALWWAPILLVLPITYLLAQKLSSVLGPPLPPGLQLWQAPLMYLWEFAFLFVMAIGEEVGWMGYLAPRIAPRRGALGASLLVGAIWAAWHVVPYYAMGHHTWWVIWQCVFTVFLRTLIFWASCNNGGSLVAAEILHAESNIGYQTFPNGGALYDPFATALVLGGWVLAIAVLWDPRTLARLRWSRVVTLEEGG
jgi:hypothetical protein